MTIRVLLTAILITAIYAAPTSAQQQSTSIAEAFRAESQAEATNPTNATTARALLPPANLLTAAPRGEIHIPTVEDSIARYVRSYRHNRLAGRSLLTLGALAIAGAFYDYAFRSDELGMTGTQGALMFGGFGVVVLGENRQLAARRAFARAEEWRNRNLAPR